MRRKLAGLTRWACGGVQSGKAGKGNKSSSYPMPLELVGLSRETPDTKDPICYNFNLGGCPHAQPGGRCTRGKHVCMKCFENHSQRTHS